MSKPLGRNWYQVNWLMWESVDEFDVKDWEENYDHIPEYIDVLASNPKQASDIACSCYPQLNECVWVAAQLVGTERQFQEKCEPEGEVNRDLLPF